MIISHEKLLDELIASTAPQLTAAFGVGIDTAAEMLIVAGDNPDRIRTEPAWAKLCGVCPGLASFGKLSATDSTVAAHAALYRTVIRMQHHEPTRAYVAGAGHQQLDLGCS
ncbi:transposase [Nocardia takedensis]|uniref:transposase n=1 Tax=Nocardia takedensis TaxID=259390 RepID=UPI000315F9D8|nr:transposase [Nocardia takedensis]